jgi:hypothetical protein
LLDGMKVGDLSEVIRGQGGYQVIKLDNRTDDKVMTAEEAHDKIADGTLRREARRRDEAVPRQAACPGDHRVEERRNQEGVGDAHGLRNHRCRPIRQGPPPAATPEPAKSKKPAKPVKPTD